MSSPAVELTTAGLAAAGVATFFAGAAGLVRGRLVDRRLRTFVATTLPPVARDVQPVRPRVHVPRLSALRRLSKTSLGAKIRILLAGRRIAAFEKQLPQAIDSMAGTLQAGSTLPQAMEIIAQELPPPLSDELKRVLRDMELGLSFPDALAGMCERVPSSDLLLLSSAIAIQRRVGGDLAQLLRRISHTIRERLRIRGELRVLTAQGRYSAYVVAALPVLLFCFLWNSNYEYLSQLFLPGLPRLLLGGGAVGIGVGFVAMKRVATVDV